MLNKILLLLCSIAFLSFALSSSQRQNTEDDRYPFIGEIRLYVGDTPPPGWMFCHGQIMNISTNSAFYSILGTTYGGDGRTTFALPDYRGRVNIGATLRRRKYNAHTREYYYSYPPGESINLGEKGGAETREVVTSNGTAHTHKGTVSVPSFEIDPKIIGTKFIEGSEAIMTVGNTPFNCVLGGTLKTNAVGGVNSTTTTKVDIMQSYTPINFIICTEGTYPSRR